MEFLLCRFDNGVCLALVTVQYDKHLGQEEAEKAERGRHRKEQQDGYPWLLQVGNRHGNEKDDRNYNQSDRSDQPSALCHPFGKKLTA
jgi:hypothetical protein